MSKMASLPSIANINTEAKGGDAYQSRSMMTEYKHKSKSRER